MAITQSQLDALEAAMVSGTLSVEFDGRKVTYRSMEELKEARRLALRALGKTPSTQRTYAEHSKGL